MERRRGRRHPSVAAEEWDQGIRKSSGRIFYPDSQVVDYKNGVTTMTSRGGMAGTTPVLVSALERPLDPRYLNIKERELIRDLKAAGSSIRAIAHALGR